VPRIKELGIAKSMWILILELIQALPRTIFKLNFYIPPLTLSVPDLDTDAGFFDEKKFEKRTTKIFFFLFFDLKLQFTYPSASIKDVKASGEAFSTQKRTSSVSKNEIFKLFSILPSWIRIVNPDPDPGTPLNPDPIRIRIHNSAKITSTSPVIGF
jgi:hypothetical protein